METEYGNLAQNGFFENHATRGKKLSRMMVLDLTGILPKEIFHLLFIQMLEFQDNPLYSTSKACMYVKSWINEDVFKVRTPILPNQLQIGTDVTEQQILEIFKA